MRIGVDEFILRCVAVHGSKYNYDKVILGKDNKKKIIIVCSVHGDFLQSPNKHVDKGRGCPSCGEEKSISRLKNTFAKQKTNDEFIVQANTKHNNRYEYLSEYKSCFEKVQIKCKKCATVWQQTPANHLFGQGCPKCALVESKGEKKIADYLDSIGVKYERQKWFDDCRGKKRPLPFDFYLSEYHALIEFDGEQHFRPKNFKGSMTTKQTTRAHVTTKKYDVVKNNYCLSENIQLLRISYNQINNIESMLSDFLEKLNVNTVQN